MRRRFVGWCVGGLGMAAALLFGSMGAGAQTWTEYRPAGGGFRVEMPGTPQIETYSTPMAAGPVTEAGFDAGDDDYEVVFFGIPKEGSNSRTAEESFKDTRDALTRGVVGHKETDLKLDSVEGRQLIIMESNGRVSVYRTYVSGNRYWRICVSNRNGTLPPGAARFLESFKLVAQ